MRQMRVILIELCGMAIFAALIGYMGPFGTYFDANFPARAWKWGLYLMGAYAMVRPSILLWSWVPNATKLPRRSVIFLGVGLTSIPLALAWYWRGGDLVQCFHGFVGVVPFAFLCAVGVLCIARSAESLDLWMQK
ncbi:hypothetical protein WBP07_21590 (plasmid) [Novosphingobium sp. BL-8A]|uniref:hypothetical protein n=1 Tax=Novosphingobium sp. BL-8A TaxID=3127639 RepID=UPI0037570D58